MSGSPLPRCSRLRALARETRGVAAMEFALVAPILIVLYFGFVDVTLGLAFKYRLHHATAAVNDLAGQLEKTNARTIDDLFVAADAILEARDEASTVLRTTQLKVVAGGQATVEWSRARNTTRYGKGSLRTVPSSLVVQPGDYLLLTEMSHAYAPVTMTFLKETISMSHQVYGRPRSKKSVVCTDC